MVLKIFKQCKEKEVKGIKEWLANTNINTADSKNIVSYGSYDCGRNCIDRKYLKENGEQFYSYVTKRQYSQAK